VVETDRDPSLYDKTGPIDVRVALSGVSLAFVDFALHPRQWQRSTATVPPPAGLLISLATTASTKVRLSFSLDHRPERFALAPKVASLLGMTEGDRVSVLQALWSYIKMHKLQADDKRHIKTDPSLKEVSSFGFGLSDAASPCSCSLRSHSSSQDKKWSPSTTCPNTSTASSLPALP
jgi:hypothetical protein